MAGIGGQALQAQQGIYGAQATAGAQQQAQQQQMINQAITDYANQQQYPLMQLGVMSNMLRGLPMQAATTNQYVAAPNPVTQGIGLAGAGASIYNALKKEGGVIKEKKMAAGGIASYDIGGSVRHDLYAMDPSEIQEYIKTSASPTAKKIAEDVLRDKTGRAGGGIIAFANPTDENNQSLVKEDKAPTEDNAYLNRSRGLVEGVKNIVRPFTDPRNYDPLQKGSDVIRNTAQSIKEFGQVPVEEQAAKFRSYAMTPTKEAPPAEAAPSKSIVAAAPANALPPAPTNVKTDELGRADAAKQGPTAAPAGQANLNAAPSSKIMPTSGIKLPSNLGIPAELAAPANPDANKTITELAAEKEAYMGPNTGNQQARSQMMAERANAKDEARRATSLRMAEFFGAWGSTPGNTIVAGLNALKNKIPDFITDMKEESKIRRQIDKDIAELDKIERLEKAGNWDEAAKRKTALSKEAVDIWGTKVKAYSDAQHTAATREVGLAKASEGAGNVGKLYNQAVTRYQTEEKNIVAEKKDDKEYRFAVAKLSANPKDADALATKNRKETEWNNRLKPLKEDMDYYKSKAGRETGESSGSSNAKPVIKLD
jgi:hypothetical protein